MKMPSICGAKGVLSLPQKYSLKNTWEAKETRFLGSLPKLILYLAVGIANLL